MVQSKTDLIGNDYASSRRRLDFLAQDLNSSEGCPQTTTGHSAQTKYQAVVDLQNVQLTFSDLPLDVISKNLLRAQADVYCATGQYSQFAEYI